MSLAINYRSQVVEAIVMLPSYICMGLLLGAADLLFWLLAILPALVLIGLVYRVSVVRAAERQQFPAVWAVGLVGAQILFWWVAYISLMVLAAR